MRALRCTKRMCPGGPWFAPPVVQCLRPRKMGDISVSSSPFRAVQIICLHVSRRGQLWRATCASAEPRCCTKDIPSSRSRNSEGHIHLVLLRQCLLPTDIFLSTLVASTSFQLLVTIYWNDAIWKANVHLQRFVLQKSGVNLRTFLHDRIMIQTSALICYKDKNSFIHSR